MFDNSDERSLMLSRVMRRLKPFCAFQVEESVEEEVKAEADSSVETTEAPEKNGSSEEKVEAEPDEAEAKSTENGGKMIYCLL